MLSGACVAAGNLSMRRAVAATPLAASSESIFEDFRAKRRGEKSCADSNRRRRPDEASQSV
jgi:hypothetical protein